MQLLIFIVSGISVCVGYFSALAINYWMLKSARTEITNERDELKIGTELERKEMKEFFEHVQSVAETVDGSVDRHSTQVAAFSEEVVQNIAKDPKIILAAAKRLLEANVQLKGELSVAREQIRDKQSELELYMTDARTDALTEVGNRRAFDQEIRRLFAQRQRQGVGFSLLLADIDHFKWFNDYHGHQMGDIVLCEVARTIKRTMRDMDLVCRYGGEEFAAILPGTSLKNAVRAAQRLHTAVERMTHKAGDVDLRVTVSVGVGEVFGDEDVETLIKRVDDCLYAAKKGGRNCIFYHDGEQPQHSSIPVVVSTPKFEPMGGAFANLNVDPNALPPATSAETQGIDAFLSQIGSPDSTSTVGGFPVEPVDPTVAQSSASSLEVTHS